MNRLLLILFALFALSTPARAEEQDVAAATRSVVRIVIVATKGEEAYFVGHATGFAVAPDKIITNAHVVEILRTEPGLALGIVPSEGKRSFGGKVVAYSPGNDLALIQLTNGTLPVSTFFAGGVTDGQHVTAIGYPGSVDRAQGLDLNGMIQPIAPVKTSGNVSTGRASKGFDTVLHTAPMAQGNSGGPLVDDCGRVLGVNSFGSLSDGADAEFGFAVSDREVASFLRQAGVQFQRTTEPCRTIADLDAAEAQRQQAEAAQRDAQDRARSAAMDQRLDDARRNAEQEVITSRENMMALAAVLLAVAVLTLGAAGLFHTQGKRTPAIRFGIGGGVALLGALGAFFLRPSFGDVEDKARASMAQSTQGVVTSQPAAYDPNGDNICRIDPARSRITVSEAKDVPLHWQPGGCVNRETQYAFDGKNWVRVLVPNGDATVTINAFDADSGTLRSDRYLVDAATMDQARTLRGKLSTNACTADQDALGKLQQLQTDIRAILPAQPNERLVYRCTKGTLDAPSSN